MRDSDLKILQMAEFEILKDVKNVCENNRIRYFLSSGTAIGAVRHNGFIPWDDDIDIAMPIEDYYRFLKIAPSQLGDKYFVQNFLTDNHFTMCFSKVRKNGTAMIPPNHWQQNIHHGIWIDIFPMIYIKNDRDFTIKRRLITVCDYLMMDSFVTDNEEEFKGVFKGWYKFFIMFLKIPNPIRKAVKSALIKYIFGAKNGKYLTEVYGNIKWKYPSDLFDDSCMVEFEGEQFPLPIRYDEFLSIQYGDYMTLPPEDQRVNHGDLIFDNEKSYELVIKEKKEVEKSNNSRCI